MKIFNFAVIKQISNHLNICNMYCVYKTKKFMIHLLCVRIVIHYTLQFVVLKLNTYF